MAHSTRSEASHPPSPSSQARSTTEMEWIRGQPWNDEAIERVDDRDLENIDLDIECLNEVLERLSAHRTMSEARDDE